MKKLFIFLMIWNIVSESMAQDTIRMQNGMIVSGNVNRITEDTVYLNIKAKNSLVQTFVLRREIAFISILKADNLAQQADSLQLGYWILENGERIFAQYLNYEKFFIEIYESNAGNLYLRAEDLKDYQLLPATGKYQLKMKNNNVFYGELAGFTPGEIKLKTETSGIITLYLALVDDIKPIEDQNLKQGTYWMPNPNATRYFFAPTAFNLKKGDGYYQNAYLLANSLNYGITDNFSFGGLVVIPAFALITPKFGFTVTPYFHLGAGFMGGVILGPALAGLAYGVSTLGNIENNITLGIGYYGFQQIGDNAEESFSSRNPVITLNGMLRTGKKYALVTENWAVPYNETEYKLSGEEIELYKYYYVFTYGFRIMREKLTFDIALINNKDIFELVPIGLPYLDLVYKF